MENFIQASYKKKTELNNKVAKPFLKWAGGKTQLLEIFRSQYPDTLHKAEIENYFEPFLGSGAVFFNIANNFKIKNAFLFDINEDLVFTWKTIQSNVSKLITNLLELETGFLSREKPERTKFYYEQRQLFNTLKGEDDQIWKSALLIFLNRTCFNGLYRVNSKGEFNTPAGDYSNPTICDEKNLIYVNKLLQIAEIRKADFKEMLNYKMDKSFAYFDPPYRPISKTSSFKAYSNSGFDDEKQIELYKVFAELNKSGFKLMLSNSDPKNHNPDDNFFDTLYNEFNIKRIPARRMINSNPEKRGNINEIIITNYPVNQ